MTSPKHEPATPAPADNRPGEKTDIPLLRAHIRLCLNMHEYRYNALEQFSKNFGYLA